MLNVVAMRDDDGPGRVRLKVIPRGRVFQIPRGRLPAIFCSKWRAILADGGKNFIPIPPLRKIFPAKAAFDNAATCMQPETIQHATCSSLVHLARSIENPQPKQPKAKASKPKPN